jgi:hypothetical protein
MHSLSLNTPLLISPHRGKDHNPFPPGGRLGRGLIACVVKMIFNNPGSFFWEKIPDN